MYKSKLDVQMATLKVCQAISRVELNKMVYTQLLIYKPKKWSFILIYNNHFKNEQGAQRVQTPLHSQRLSNTRSIIRNMKNLTTIPQLIPRFLMEMLLISLNTPITKDKSKGKVCLYADWAKRTKNCRERYHSYSWRIKSFMSWINWARSVIKNTKKNREI